MSQQFERATGRSKTQRGLYLINAEAMRRKSGKKLPFVTAVNKSVSEHRQQLQEEGTLCIALFQDRSLETL